MAALVDDADKDIADLPNSMKGHRACLRCGLVKCFDQFYAEGCENCPFLELAERQDRVQSCTTSNFEGTVAMMKPQDSWVARWEGISRNLPGVYALSLEGEMPEQIMQFLRDKRISCRANAPGGVRGGGRGTSAPGVARRGGVGASAPSAAPRGGGAGVPGLRRRRRRTVRRASVGCCS